MANYSPGVRNDVVASYINSKFAEQPWYRENANFITSLGGLLATILVWLGSQPIAADPTVQMIILVVGFVLTTLGVKVTKNGFSKSQVAKVNAQVADHIDNTDLVVEESNPVEDFIEDTAETLAERVAEFNRAREM